jgi:ParB-like chromosome segregation protein Spo0J
MLETEVVSIRFAEIDWGDSTHLITYGPSPEKLLLSIRTVGLLQKPLLQRTENGRLRIICGSRRLAACQELGIEPLQGHVLSSSFPPADCLRMAVYDNVASRILNPVEKSLTLTKMAAYVSEQQLIHELMPLLDLESSTLLLRRYGQLSQLEPVILDALVEGRLHERTAFALTPLEADDRLALFRFFKMFPFSVSVQEELVETVMEIAQRDQMTPAEILAEEERMVLREARKRPLRQRARDVREHLQARRTPRLTARKKRFAREVRELGLPSGVRLVPPPYFEGPRWRLECDFQRNDELADSLRQAAQLAEQPKFRRLMEGLAGSSKQSLRRA